MAPRARARYRTSEDFIRNTLVTDNLLAVEDITSTGGRVASVTAHDSTFSSKQLLSFLFDLLLLTDSGISDPQLTLQNLLVPLVNQLLDIEHVSRPRLGIHTLFMSLFLCRGHTVGWIVSFASK